MDRFPEEPPSSGVPIPPVDKESCALLGQTGLLVQAVMAVIVVGSLVVKRSRENPRRPWPVWLADVGKQIIGQGFLHFTNVVFSTLFSHASRGDACTAYFLSIFVDCTLGVLIIYSTLRIFHYVLIQRMHLKGYRSGQYYKKQKRRSTNPSGDDSERDVIYEAEARESRPSIDSLEDGRKPAPTSTEPASDSETRFQFSWWGKQLLVYLASLVVMKLAILGFFWIPAVLAIGDWMLSWLGEDTKIVFVLMIFPLAMNAFQFLLIDAILKSKTPFSETASLEGAEPSLSRRTSEDGRRRSHDEEEGRAFLLHDTTHDELDPGAKDAMPLPSFYSPPDENRSGSGRLQRTDSATSHVAKESEQPSVDTKQEWSSWSAGPDEDEDDDYSTTPRPTGHISHAQHTKARRSLDDEARNSSAIQLRTVPSLKRQSSETSSHDSEKSDEGKEMETNGWDWLSDDGSTSRQREQDEDFSSMSPSSTPFTADAPLAKAKTAKVE